MVTEEPEESKVRENTMSKDTKVSVLEPVRDIA